MRDYNVKKAIEANEEVIVKLEGSDLRMLLSVEQLKNHISESADFFESMFDAKSYKLLDYFWNPTEFLTEIEEIRYNLLGSEWFHLLKDEFEKQYLIDIGVKVASLRKSLVIYPDKKDVFKAFKLAQPQDIKVVILGQDPYPHKAADGLAFSSKEPKLPAALKHIYDAIEQDIKFGLYLDKSPSLEYWATQGVFLLNTILTVTGGYAKSHDSLNWQKFTSTAISRLSRKHDNIVFLLLGSVAGVYERYIANKENHLIIKTEHPTMAFYEGREWYFDRCFSKTNEYLKEHGREEIRW